MLMYIHLCVLPVYLSRSSTIFVCNKAIPNLNKNLSDSSELHCASLLLTIFASLAQHIQNGGFFGGLGETNHRFFSSKTIIGT